MLPIVHYVHILLGSVYLGGSLLFSWAVYPVLSRLPAGDAARLHDRLGRLAGPILGTSGGLTLIVGPLRAWVGGGVTGLADLGQPYAQMVATAFLLVLAISILGGRFRRQFLLLATDPAVFAARAPSLALRHAVIDTVLFALVIAIMMAFGLGLY